MDEFGGASEFSEPMPCFEFNGALSRTHEDGQCVHCRNFLTLECPYIDRFLSEDDG